MLLGTSPDKGPHPKRCLRSSPDHSFRHVHRGRPWDNNQVLHGFVPWGSSPLSQIRRLPRKPLRIAKIILLPLTSMAPAVPHLQLYSFIKSPNLFDLFEKDSSPWLRSRWNNVGGSLTVGIHWLKKRSIASNLFPSSEIWVSVAQEVIVPLILPWPSSRPYQPEILGISPPKMLKTSPHTPCAHISRSLRMARPSTKKLGRRK